MWDQAVNIHDVRIIHLKTKVLFGVGAVNSFDLVAADLRQSGISAVLAVTGRRAYRSTGAWDAIESSLRRHGISAAIYDGVTPNPTADQVDAAAALGAASGAGAVLAIGGGSAIDAGKGAAIAMRYPGVGAAAIFSGEFQPEAALPVIAVNLTHGTGSEANRFAVVSIPEKEFKPALACDFLYPRWAVDDPGLMTGLSPHQTAYVSIDAVNHVVEAATTRSANPHAIMLGCETCRLVSEYLPRALRTPTDPAARYFLAYAALIAGQAFDDSLLHYTHALEHPLSAVKPDLAHGLGLAMLLPAVIEHIWPVSGPVLAALLAPIAPGFRGEAGEARCAARAVELWLARNGAPGKLTDAGFAAADVDHLTDLALATPSLRSMLDQAPDRADREAVRAIYAASLTPLA